jgi:hypothetical protein
MDAERGGSTILVLDRRPARKLEHRSTGVPEETTERIRLVIAHDFSTLPMTLTHQGPRDPIASDTARIICEK